MGKNKEVALRSAFFIILDGCAAAQISTVAVRITRNAARPRLRHPMHSATDMPRHCDLVETIRPSGARRRLRRGAARCEPGAEQNQTKGHDPTQAQMLVQQHHAQKSRDDGIDIGNDAGPCRTCVFD